MGIDFSGGTDLEESKSSDENTVCSKLVRNSLKQSYVCYLRRLFLLAALVFGTFGFSPSLASYYEQTELEEQAEGGSTLGNGALGEFFPGELVIKYKDTSSTRKFAARVLSGDDYFSLSDKDIAHLIAESHGLELEGYRALADMDMSKSKRLKKYNLAGKFKYSKSALVSKSKELSKVMVLELNENEDIPSLVSKLRNEKGLNNAGIEIDEVYPNYIFRIQDHDTQIEPNDTFYYQQWGLDYINAIPAWDFARGEGTVVAVIDTGVNYKHPDLRENIWLNEDEIPGNRRDDDRNGFVDDVRGWDFVSRSRGFCAKGEDCKKEDNDPSDFHNHGTHCAGTIAAAAHNSRGISGIAPRAKIMPLRAAYATRTSAVLKSSDIADAIRYAIYNGADVINMSFAGTELGVLKEVIKLADSFGVVMVAAAGNSNTSIKHFPAALDEVISVGAVDHNGMKTDFSNYGDWVDIAAPGAHILSALAKGSYGSMSGTSMAAPYVSGAVALIKSKNKVKTLSPKAIKKRILDAGVDSGFSFLKDSEDFLKILNADVSHPLEVDELSVPSRASFGQLLRFEGVGTNGRGVPVTEYSWRSSIDGELSSNRVFQTKVLSPGQHQIYFRVKDQLGNWSPEVMSKLIIDDHNVLANGNQLKPKIARGSTALVARLSDKSKKFSNYVQSIEWESNLDGQLHSHSRKLRLDELSEGVHRITLKLQDSHGVWYESSRLISNR